MCCFLLLTCCLEKTGSQIVLPTKSLSRVPCHQAPRSMAFLDIRYPRSFNSFVPSDFDSSLESVWLWGYSDQPQYVRHNESLGLLLKVMLKSFDYQKYAPASETIRRSNENPQSNARHPPRNGQTRRRLVQPPG